MGRGYKFKIYSNAGPVAELKYTDLEIFDEMMLDILHEDDIAGAVCVSIAADMVRSHLNLT